MRLAKKQRLVAQAADCACPPCANLGLPDTRLRVAQSEAHHPRHAERAAPAFAGVIACSLRVSNLTLHGLWWRTPADDFDPCDPRGFLGVWL